MAAARGGRRRHTLIGLNTPYDIVAIDVDGTLLRSDKRLADRDAAAVRAAARAGVRIVLATARPPRAIRALVDTLGLLELSPPSRSPGPEGALGLVTINYNGAALWDARRGRAIEHTPIESPLARNAVYAARGADRDVMVSIEILDKWYTDRIDPDLPTETSKSFAPDFIGHLDAFLGVPPTKVLFLAPPERLVRVRDALDHRFGRRGLLELKVSDEHLFSVIAPGVDKGTTLASLAARLGVARERVLAIGDAPNDAKMLEWAGKGVAVSNAWKEARDAADETLDLSNDQCAVAHVIERDVLG